MGRTMRSVGGTQSALLAFGLAVFQASPLVPPATQASPALPNCNV